jgi:ABC-type cobalamin/Fe3+-siderophores transport system ATPase subunit
MALHDINIALQFEKVILIKDGNVIGSGDPASVLSRDMLRKAFDVDVEIRKTGAEGIHISYENNF